jgi:hypothetical protein
VPVGEHVPAKEKLGIERQIATRMILGKFMIPKIIDLPLAGDPGILSNL